MTLLRSRRALVVGLLALGALLVIGLLVRPGGAGPTDAAPSVGASASTGVGTPTTSTSSTAPSAGSSPTTSPSSPGPVPTPTASPASSPGWFHDGAPGDLPGPEGDGAPAAARSPAPTPPPATTSASDAREVLRLTNVERASAGCTPLAWDSRLAAAASGHSTDMASHDYFSHTSRDGRGVADRVTGSGYAWSRVAENIAAGQPSPRAVVAAWMASDGHRANILDCRLTDLGVGVARSAASGNTPYWAQDFGTPR